MTFSAKYRGLTEPFSLGGRNLAYMYNKGKKADIDKQLAEINSYYFHREAKRPRVWNPIYVYNRREILQADLIDLTYLHQENDGYKYILVVVDTFSRFAWVRPLKSTQAAECLREFKDIYRQTGYFKVLYCDRGVEFKNRLMRTFLTQENIEQRFPNHKCGHVERLNRTLQSLIYRYLSDRATNSYVGKLQTIVSLYNNRWHTAIKCTPSFADDPINKKYVLNIISQKYDKVAKKRKKPKYKVGQIVVIQKNKGVFAKGYERIFVRERFKIHKVHDKTPIPMYTLRTHLEKVRNKRGQLVDVNETLDGRWYENELQPVEDETYRVIILERKREPGTNRPMSLVTYEGYPSNQNRWYYDDDLETIF